ncbi:MerR family transcriptional regulator [Allohahella marinimesophila]|uniref:MerR family transcriptional regulator n=2 Tax=Allohahella marinimesophila TaxID=1054972 RepID=A0ABP7NJZ4_9GAMM
MRPEGSHDKSRLEREYTIDELARATGTTTRNIRAYQERGILRSPRLRGRKGIYSDEHYSRLRLIANLLERGYTLSSIGDLLTAVEQGMDLKNFVGIESALTSPWTDEETVVMPLTQLMAMFDTKMTSEALAKARDLDLFRIEGDHVSIRSLRMMQAGAELVSTGIPFEELLDIIQMLRGNVERVANELVKLVSEHVLEKYDFDATPPKEDLPQLVDLIWRLRPLAEMAVHAELARAMERAANHFLGDRLETIIQELEVLKRK